MDYQTQYHSQVINFVNDKLFRQTVIANYSEQKEGDDA